MQRKIVLLLSSLLIISGCSYNDISFNSDLNSNDISLNNSIYSSDSMITSETPSNSTESSPIIPSISIDNSIIESPSIEISSTSIETSPSISINKISYTIRHYLEKEIDNEFDIIYEENFLIDEFSKINIVATSYDGYIANVNNMEVIVKEDNNLFEFYYTRKAYKLSFVTNSNYQIEDINLKHGHVLDNNIIPIKEGHTFSNWYLDINLSIPFEKMPMENTIIYASYLEELKPSNFTYEISDDGVSISGSNYSGEDLIIPSYIGGKPVISLQKSCFIDKEYKNIGLPNTLKTINKSAIRNCINIEKIIIPKSVTYIDEYAFSGCESLKEVIFEENSLLTFLGFKSFANCPLVNIKIPFIGNGSNIYHLGHIFGASNPRYNNNYVPTSLIEITLLKTCDVIETYAFYECVHIEKVILNEGITSIESCAFQYCYFLKNINIPNSINKIASSAFYQCISLNDIKILDNSNLYVIEEYAFYKCTSLIEVNIPDNLFSIGTNAFRGCNHLKVVDIKLTSNLTEINERAFNSCSSLEEIIIPSKVTTMGGYVFGSCSSLTIYIDFDTIPLTWDENFNNSNRPIVYLK